ncbi:Protein of unknown function DUF594 [Dillenia turbinata]|uniref:DUF4220 domain-containing protein n=1 Tax=Dillenia turbinata TaxID=194707 RepID=A0AAN8UQW6_9MAGN
MNGRYSVVLCLCLQIVLIIFGNRLSKSWIRIIIWVTYLSVDWGAILCLGILSNNLGDFEGDSPDPHSALTALWASFLPLHLGGPDTLTAYSLEDNELCDPFARVLQESFFLFRTWRRLYANLILDFNESGDCRRIMEGKSAADAFKLGETETGLIYDVLCTKASLVYSLVGVRFITFLSSAVALVIFSIMIDQHSFSETDMAITYLLLVGDLILEKYAGVILKELVSIHRTMQFVKLLLPRQTIWTIRSPCRQSEWKWEMVSRVWVDMLCSAVSQCGWNHHAQQLWPGGELPTLVRLLMANLGLNARFQIEQGHARLLLD